MSDLADFRALAAEVLAEFGTTATWRVPTETYGDDGNVTSTFLSYTVQCSDMVDEFRRYGQQDTMQRSAGTIYVGFTGTPITPSIGHRVIYRGRFWIVTAVQPYAVTGADVMWRVDVAETGADSG